MISPPDAPHSEEETVEVPVAPPTPEVIIQTPPVVYGPPRRLRDQGVLLVCAGLVVLFGLVYFGAILYALSHGTPGTRWYADKIAGNGLYDAGDFAGAESLYAKSVREARESGPNDWRVGLALHNLGLAYRAEGRADRAEPVLRQALTAFGSTPIPDENEPDATKALLADALEAEGKSSQALSVQAGLERSKSFDTRTGAEHGIACIDLDLGRDREAEAILRKSMPTPKDTRGRMYADMWLGMARAGEDDVLGAQRLATEALELAPGESQGRQGLIRTDAEGFDGYIALMAGDFSRALREMNGTLGILRSVPGPTPDSSATTLAQLALADAAVANYHTAEAEARQAEDAADAAWICPSNRAEADGAFPQVLIAEGRAKEAESRARKALSETEAGPGCAPSALASALNTMAVVQGHLGHTSEAETLFSRALSITSQTETPNGPAAAVIRYNQSVLMARQGRSVEADALRQQAIALWRRHVARNPGVKPSPAYGVADAPRGLPPF